MLRNIIIRLGVAQMVKQSSHDLEIKGSNPVLVEIEKKTIISLKVNDFLQV
jgi:hypothetical protein